ESLTKELGEKRFGHRPRIGDVFSGGGSVPFEAARLGASVYASDLNPLATLLTWSSINLLGEEPNKKEELIKFKTEILKELDGYITELQIEHNELGHRANSYIYCNETNCPECNYKVPLAPSWIIGRGTKTVALLEKHRENGFDIEIVQNASKEQFEEANSKITIRGNNMYCPNCELETPISVLRGDRKTPDGQAEYGLRLWDKGEFLPREDDVFQERLYCIR